MDFKLKDRDGQGRQRYRRKVGGEDEAPPPGFAMVNEKKRPHPWETHHQFSIKTLHSKAKCHICDI